MCPRTYLTKRSLSVFGYWHEEWSRQSIARSRETASMASFRLACPLPVLDTTELFRLLDIGSKKITSARCRSMDRSCGRDAKSSEVPRQRFGRTLGYKTPRTNTVLWCRQPCVRERAVFSAGCNSVALLQSRSSSQVKPNGMSGLSATVYMVKSTLVTRRPQRVPF